MQMQPVSVIISTCGSSFDTVIGVYVDLGQSNFVLVDSNDDSKECDGQQSKLEIILQPETNYLVVVVWLVTDVFVAAMCLSEL